MPSDRLLSVALGVVASLLVACSDQVSLDPPGGGSGQGADGGGGAGGGGGADRGCEPGEKPVDAGECQPAGVPPEHCGEGFVADDAGGCAVVLPSSPCGPGMLALPGETECRTVAPCGTGRWGEIPIAGESNVQFVDRSYAGADSDGSEQKPWTTIGEGIDAAEPGAIVAVAEGSYPEMVHVRQRAVRLWGRCPSLVQIEGDPYALVVGWDDPLSDTAGTEIHDLALTAAEMALVVSNTTGLIVDRVWIHDTGDAGMIMAPAWGPASAQLSRSLLEHLAGLGISAASSPLDVRETVVRDVVGGPLGEGRGVAAERISAGPMTFSLRASVIDEATGIGVSIAGLDATIESSVVRRTRAAQPDLSLGRAVTIQDSPPPDAARADVVIRQSLFDEQRDVGIFIAGSDVQIEHTVVRRTAPNAANDDYGMGIVAQRNPATDEPAAVVIRESLVDQSHDTGIGITSSTAVLESLIVRDTQPRSSDGWRGIGVIVSCDPTDGPGSSPPATAALRWSRIEHSHVGGLSVFGSSATVDGSVVRHTAPMADGRFGDGLLVLGGVLDPAALEVAASSVGDSERVGIVSFGAVVRLATTRLHCNAIDLDGEPWEAPYRFEDLGGNRCGCEQVEPCQVVSASLEPPVETSP